MKKTVIIFTTVTIFMSVTLFAQKSINDSLRKNDDVKTIFGNKKLSHGGYGAFYVGYSQIDNKDAFITGGRGSWIIGHSFAIGVGGCGFSNNLFVNNVAGSQQYNLEGGYGGLILEPIILPKFPVHLSFPVLLGAGGVSYVNTKYYDDYEPDVYVEDSEAYLIAEPGAELEMNIIKYVRIAFGVSYRFTSQLYLKNYNYNVLNGYNAAFSLKFGKF